MEEVDLTLLNEKGMLMRVLTDGRPIWVVYSGESHTLQEGFLLKPSFMKGWPDDFGIRPGFKEGYSYRTFGTFMGLDPIKNKEYFHFILRARI